MRTQAEDRKTQNMDQENVGTLKRDWLVESEDARKALHDLYFETGSLPDQQPKVKVNEPEVGNPAEQAGQIASVPDNISDTPAGSSSIGVFRNQWVRRTIYLTIAICLGFGAYRVVPRFDMSPSKPATHHIKSPLIREAMEKRQATDPTPQSGTEVAALGSLAVTPTVIMARYQPGQSSTQTLTVDNQTSEAMTFAMEAKDVVAKGDQLILVSAGDTPNSVAATVVFSQRFVRVEPMDKATVQVTLTWPTSTNVRGVVARFGSTNEGHMGGGLIATSLGTLIAFASGQESGAGAAVSAAGIQSSEARPLPISQWSEQSNSTTTRAPNFAGLGGTQ